MERGLVAQQTSEGICQGGVVAIRRELATYTPPQSFQQGAVEIRLVQPADKTCLGESG